MEEHVLWSRAAKALSRARILKSTPHSPPFTCPLINHSMSKQMTVQYVCMMAHPRQSHTFIEWNKARRLWQRLKKKPVSFWERIKKKNEMQDSKISHVINLAFDIRLNNFVAKPWTKAKQKYYQNKGQETDFPRMVYTICGVTEVGWSNLLSCIFVNYKTNTCLI